SHTSEKDPGVPGNCKDTPFDSYFPNQNQTKNGWQNYLDFHCCEKAMTAKGGDVSLCFIALENALYSDILCDKYIETYHK
uniref:Uncharacterized protein n=1 Tax=Mus spicilegus TaxID=10103 RepID=A0A8C6HZA4_MUSSI